MISPHCFNFPEELISTIASLSFLNSHNTNIDLTQQNTSPLSYLNMKSNIHQHF